MHDKVGPVLARFRSVAVGDFEAQAVVFNVGDNPRMRFGHAAEFRLPVAVENHPVDMGLLRAALPAPGPGGIEVDVRGGARGVVGIEQGPDRPILAVLGQGDGRGDSRTGHIGQFLIHQLRRVGAAFADQAAIEPLFGDALELAEQVQLRLCAGVAPLGVKQVLRDVKQQRRAAQVLQVLQAQIDILADNAGVLGVRRADQIRREFEHRVRGKFRRQPFLRQLDSIPRYARKAHLQGVALGPHGAHLNRLLRRLWRGDHRPGREIEGDAEHIGVFDVEAIFFVQLVGLSPQRPADNLFAEQLGAKRAHAQHVGDGVGVPALGEHGHRHHAAHGVAEAPGFADCVHHFAQQILLADVFGLAAVAAALDDLAAKALDLVSGHGPKVFIQRIAGFELFAVDQQGSRAGEGVAVLVEVAQQRQAAVFQDARAIFALAMESRDEIVNEFRGRGVVAYHDKTRRHADAGALPQLEGFFVVSVERFERGLQFHRQAERVQGFGFAASFFRHARADMLPKVAEPGHVAAGDVVRHGHARQFDNAAFDGVHQREIAHRPGEQRALGIGDHDAGALHIGQQLGRRQFAAAVVAVRVVRLKHTQAIAYGQTRRHDQKTAGKSLALRMTHGIDGLPRDQHGHHRGFAGAGGEF